MSKALELLAKALFTIFCIGISITPEVGMYYSWGLISPQSELTRVLLIIAFWFGGAGLCVGFGALGFWLWIVGINL